MEKLLDFLNGFNVQTLVGMTAILWYFTRENRNEIKKEIESNRNEIKKEIESIRNESKIQSKRSDRLYEMFINLLQDKKS